MAGRKAREAIGRLAAGVALAILVGALAEEGQLPGGELPRHALERIGQGRQPAADRRLRRVEAHGQLPRPFRRQGRMVAQQAPHAVGKLAVGHVRSPSGGIGISDSQGKSDRVRAGRPPFGRTQENPGGPPGGIHFRSILLQNRHGGSAQPPAGIHPSTLRNAPGARHLTGAGTARASRSGTSRRKRAPGAPGAFRYSIAPSIRVMASRHSRSPSPAPAGRAATGSRNRRW